MTIRGKYQTSKTLLFVMLGIVSALTAAHETAARAQVAVSEAPPVVEPIRQIGTPSPSVFNAATLPVAVMEKALVLSPDQKATITVLQNALQAKRQALTAAASAPAQTTVAETAAPVNSTTATIYARPNQIFTGQNAAWRNQQVANAQAIAQANAQAQAAEEAQARRLAAEQAMVSNEQITVRQIRALLSMEQITQLKATESDAQLFAGVGLPVDLLAQITLSPGERDDITTVFRDTRRRLQRTASEPARDALRNAASVKSLAALTSENKAVADAYVKAHPAVTSPGGGEPAR